MSEPDIRLLLIDDDDIDRMGVRRALKQAGVAFTAVEATDGHDHLRMAINLSNRQFRRPSLLPLPTDRLTYRLRHFF